MALRHFRLSYQQRAAGAAHRLARRERARVALAGDFGGLFDGEGLLLQGGLVVIMEMKKTKTNSHCQIF